MALGANKTDFSIDVSKLDKFIQDSRQQYETELKKIVDIPSVSMDPAHAKDITRTAEYAVELLKSIGAKAEAIPTDGNPVVYGELHAGDEFPTVMIYNHLDVQPADASEWKAPPFDMTIENGVYRGRGSTDDKGPALAVMYAANFARQNNMPINIKFLWELEEEIGSPSFEKFLEKHAKKLACNSVVISDTIWVSRDKPAIPYGLRGLQGMMVKLKTGAKDVHSGLTGGLARNPIGELAALISQCYDAHTGEVRIPGFYDDANEPTESEKQNFVNSGFSVDNFKKAHELIHVRTHDSCEGSQRIWAKPTFEVHGIVGGYTGPGVKTIVPHHAEAKISMRLVPNQDPDKIFTLVSKFIKEKAPDVEIIKEGALRPFLGVNTGPLAEAAKASMMFAFGKQPAFTREGGSIGAVLSMNQILGAPIMFLGLSLPEHGYHAINENFDWQQASGGMKMFVKYFSELASLTASKLK
jgi:acetylornithine deacetylase/succinyl-diaminopimelate desuccinylase-like protein